MKLGKAKLPKGLRVYAVGDVHGSLSELRNLLDQIEADLRDNPVKKHKIILTGDYMDRGIQSKAVVSHLISMTRRNSNVICLRGNHDVALLNFLEKPLEFGPMFFRNGGAATLRSFGVRVMAGEIDNRHLREVHEFSKVIVNPSHLAFLDGLPYSKVFGDYFFCHAGIRPGVQLNKQKKRDLMWIRHEFLNDDRLHDKVIIHGHTTCDQVDIKPNRVNIDTRCYASGKLSCLVLEDNHHRLLQT